ncbi:MAG: hypothetical protein Fur0022_02650 [Anaerolineales bacterium]
MKKRAVIYIRVSSELQGEKVSPQIQEQDCRTYCESKGYKVVFVYRDVERYRVGTKLVEPSGTRADRPGLKQMIADGYAEKYDVIVAWREDRIYRSYRPMIEVLDCLEETSIDIELVKETFDKRIAPVKAWAAKMELDAKHDRFMMGVAGRLASGKGWNQAPPYGYSKDSSGIYQVNEVEAEWVRKLFNWYADGVPLREIRRRFISNGVPQRNNNNRHLWNLAVLNKILKSEYYWTGKKPIKWGGETFEISIPTLIDTGIAQRTVERREKHKKYPAGNAKHSCLAAGLVYCAACNVRMGVVTANNGYKRKNGTIRKPWTYYGCALYTNRTYQEGCARRMGAEKLDNEIWSKVWALISEPEVFEEALERRIASIKVEEENAQADCERLERELEDLSLERQKVITWARKELITEEDMETQLMTMKFQESALKQTLADKQMLIGDRAERLMELARLYREKVKVGVELLNSIPKNDEEAELQKAFKGKIVQAIVTRIDVFSDKSIKIHCELELSECVNINSTPTCCVCPCDARPKLWRRRFSMPGLPIRISPTQRMMRVWRN